MQLSINPLLFWIDIASAATGFFAPTAVAGLPDIGKGTFKQDSTGTYKLFLPSNTRGPMPLVLMLHGCGQDPDDFAAGTRMNEAAEAADYAVLYPAQKTGANAQRCWNWYQPAHQQRGHGEPAQLVELVRTVAALHPLDLDRIYVAGMSAGGAMAAVLGEAYPDVFAAVGVHSGLAAHAASDLGTALAAMRGNCPSVNAEPTYVPTIVFHGDADRTVHSENAARVVEAVAGDIAPIEQETCVEGGRSSTREIHRSADGDVLVEHWTVHGAAHGWSGGSSKGLFTDERGPDASTRMLRFFSEYSLGGRSILSGALSPL